MMITRQQYFGSKPYTESQSINCDYLLESVSELCRMAHEDGAYTYCTDPDTGSQISGAKGGSGDGGFRLSTSSTGAKSSSHKDANGIDIYDPMRQFAQWCVLHPHVLAALSLYIEDPRWTPVWLHIQRVPPKSGKRIYIPSTSAPLAPALIGQKLMPQTVKI